MKTDFDVKDVCIDSKMDKWYVVPICKTLESMVCFTNILTFLTSTANVGEYSIVDEMIQWSPLDRL